MTTVVEDQRGGNSIGERVQAMLAWWQHSRVGRGLARYGTARGGLLAGGITYSALFSVFAALAIGYTAFMAVLGNNDDLRQAVLDSVDDALPGIIDTGDNGGMINPDDLVQDTALNLTSLIAVAVLLWTAISVMGALKRSIRAMFGILVPKANPVIARLRDLAGFLIMALAVVLTAALVIAAGTAGQWVLDLIGVEGGFASFALRALGFLAAFVVDACVFILLFRVLAGVRAPRRDLFTAAAVGAVAAGLLRFFGTSLVGSADDPLLAASAALITLLLWINLLARVTLMLAAWTANPPAPPKPKDPAATNFDQTPNYVTLSAPHTLQWDYEALTGTVQADREVREAVLTEDLERLGEDGAEALAAREAEQARRAEIERVLAEESERDAYWGGLIGAVGGWSRRRGRRKEMRREAYERCPSSGAAPRVVTPVRCRPAHCRPSSDLAETDGLLPRPKDRAPLFAEVGDLGEKVGVGSAKGVGLEAGAQGVAEVEVEVADRVQGDALGAYRGALADVRAATEALGVLLGDHRDHPAVTLGLALRQQAQVGDLRGGEQHRGAVGAGCHAGAATDAGCGLEGGVGVGLGDRGGVRVRGGSGVGGDEAAGLDDPVEGRAVHHEVLDHRERVGAPRLDGDGVPVLEGTHVQLAGGGDLGTVGDAVDHQAAHAADALAAVVVEGHRFVAGLDELLVQDVEHLQERHVLRDAVERVVDHPAASLGIVLAPDFEGDSHL